MKIIEQFIEAKTGNPELCEDGIAANDCFAAVIDGATSKGAFTFQSKTSGRIAMELIREAVLGFNPGIDAAAAVHGINAHIREWYKEQGILDEMRAKSEERCTASAVLYSDVKKEIWLIGDCQALLNGRPLKNEKQADRIFSEMRALLIHAELAQGKTEAELLLRDTSRERLLDLLRQQTKLQNTRLKSEFAYYVIDGFEWAGFESELSGREPETGLLIFPVTEPHGEIILASDGYPELLPSLAETEASLAGVLREDPLCYKEFRTTKGCYSGNLSFDDRAYIRFSY